VWHAVWIWRCVACQIESQGPPPEEFEDLVEDVAVGQMIEAGLEQLYITRRQIWIMQGRRDETS
jgi:hypothetical protein